MIAVADATHIPLPDRSVDLVIGSPPYCDARWYGNRDWHARKCQDWIDWMLVVTAEAIRVSRGPVIWVAAGVTRRRNYQPACEGLMYEWWRRGGHAYRPVYWHKPASIPGSGGDDWFRADVEYCMCLKSPGKLPWSNNTAKGHPPKWGPGGEMSHRLSDGTRVNQWGKPSSRNGRRPNGEPKPPSGMANSRPLQESKTGYVPPKLANPGNLIQCSVGGGHTNPLAHENEAPFPEPIPEFFILSLCPPGGIVLDPFSGSGTTAAVALANGRRAIAFDIRESQAGSTHRRVATVQPVLF